MTFPVARADSDSVAALVGRREREEEMARGTGENKGSKGECSTPDDQQSIANLTAHHLSPLPTLSLWCDEGHHITASAILSLPPHTGRRTLGAVA